MNENVFVSERNHTRLRFEPLTTTCRLVCQTPQSPCAQTIDVTGVTPTYNPNRQLTPTVIYPMARVNDPDNVFPKGAVNELFLLDSLTWLVNGEPINEQWTLNTDYTIDTSATDTRGMLTIYKNLPASTVVTLTFSATFIDWRTKMEYKVCGDEDVILVTTDKGEDVYACSADKSAIDYDPLYDDLLLFDYLVARGLEQAANRANYVNGKNYLQTVNVPLTIGTTPQVSLPSGITMRVVKPGTTTALVPASIANPEIVSITYPDVVFDMRVIDKEDYEIQYVKNNAIIARASVGLHQKATMPFSAKPLRNADMPVAMRLYTNMAMMNLKDRAVEHPELYYMIKWFTQSVVATTTNGTTTYAYGNEKEWQRGTMLQALVNEIGIGHTANDSHFQLWFSVEAHGARELLADELNDVLTDENGEMLID